jgi:hypothetical protein
VEVTSRADWLVDGLSALPNVFVSASPQWSDEHEYRYPVTARLVGHYPAWFPASDRLNEDQRANWLPPYYEIMRCLLTIEVPTEQDVRNFAPQKEVRLVETFRSTLGVRASLVVYPTEVRADGMWDVCYVWEPEGGRLLSPEDYAAELNKERDPRAEDEPQIKEINRSINDLFQRWTRTMMSGQFSINDLDALWLRRKAPGYAVLLELKRGTTRSSSVAGWQPYLDDVPNYLLMKSVTRHGAPNFDVTIQYRPDDPGRLAVHTVTLLSRMHIVGFRKILAADSGPECISLLDTHLDAIADDAYTSGHRRAR